MPKLAPCILKIANINKKDLTVYNSLYGRRQQSRRTKTANSTKVYKMILLRSTVTFRQCAAKKYFCDICDIFCDDFCLIW